MMPLKGPTKVKLVFFSQCIIAMSPHNCFIIGFELI